MYDDGITTIGQAHVPPRYRLFSVKTPILILYGGQDTLIDIRATLSECPDHVKTRIIPEYEHLDFLFGRDIDKKVVPVLIECLRDIIKQ